MQKADLACQVGFFWSAASTVQGREQKKSLAIRPIKARGWQKRPWRLVKAPDRPTMKRLLNASSAGAGVVK
jgi:hypothetical protein